ncbi:hypothetical protein SY83_10945 [Paenibacillus swuensis]|uniref:Uncharacterized protein n=1 Tax=Paenibacillus swuensis TaxID=1178515 RepID=A0A172TI18_9BACL|nr:hypothetical protein [Paenibacillus swuensis]ANE46705.1 hypothetical protein SY83_10945 [Paenibacillus swuensis]
MVLLFWILGIYGICALLVHAFYRNMSKTVKPKKHYIIITYNNQQQLEWVMGSLFLCSLLKGEEIKVTIRDEGSTDDTVPIAWRLAAKRFGGLTVEEASTTASISEVHSADEEVIVVDVNQAGELAKLPLVY